MFGKEPAAIVNGLSGVLQQILPLLVLVGVIDLPDKQLAGWISIIGIVFTFIATYLIRQSVVPTERANSQIEMAISMPKTSTVEDVMKANEKKEDKGEA